MPPLLRRPSTHPLISTSAPTAPGRSAIRTLDAPMLGHRPRHTGFLFSRNARTPSCPSALAATWLTIRMLRFAERRGWIDEHWQEVPIVALAGLCFAAAQAIGGSGFIACFVGGLLLSGMGPPHKEKLLRGAVATGEALALLTWIAFGVGAVARIVDGLSWAALLYAVLSLTVIRMLPVFLCLAGTGMRTAD